MSVKQIFMVAVFIGGLSFTSLLFEHPAEAQWLASIANSWVTLGVIVSAIKSNK